MTATGIIAMVEHGAKALHLEQNEKQREVRSKSISSTLDLCQGSFSTFCASQPSPAGLCAICSCP